MNYYIIIINVVYDIKLSNVIRLFIGFDKLTYFSGGSGMEVDTRNIDLLRIEMCIFEFINISAKYNIIYVIYLNFIYPS